MFAALTGGQGGANDKPTQAAARAPPTATVSPRHQPSGHKVARAKLAWTGVSFAVNGKQVLRDCAGLAKPGELVALMGASGAGKTTLLDLLAGRIDRFRRGRSVKGEVLLNDKRVTSGSFGKLAAYVQQHDSLVGVLSVREALFTAARLAGVPTDRVDPLIQRLGLKQAAHVKVGNIFIKGISGGQKRRLSLAEQLLGEPSLLLLDEPTSGLDSASALNVVTLLRDLAHRDGCTVVSTIHQPASEVWACFDKVSFMLKGQVVYFGDAGEWAVSYFASAGYECPLHANPADFIVGLINEDFPDHGDTNMLLDKWKTHRGMDRHLTATVQEMEEAMADAASHAESHLPPRTRAVWPVRFAVLVSRDLRELLRDPGIIVVRLIMYTGLSFLIGAMFYDLGNEDEDEDIVARVSILFYVAAFMVFMSVAVLPFFVMQREIFIKERANGSYGVVEYVLSKWITSVPGVFLLTIVSSTLIMSMAALNGFWVYTLDLFLSLMFAEAFMSFMAALVPHYIIGIALAAGCFGFFMLCEGFFKIRDDIPPWLIWGYHIAPHTYSFRVFMHNEFEPIHEFNSSFYANGTDVLEFYDMEDVDVWQDLGILAAYAAGFQVCFFVVLYVCHTGKR